MNDSARYIKIVEWSDEDQCFIGQCPGVVGPCCHGDNEVEVYAELCQIVDECLEIFKQDRNPLPPATAGQRISADSSASSFVAFSSDELVLLNNALNEILNGVNIEEPEFATRLGAPRGTSAALLDRLTKLIKELGVK